MKYPVIVIAGLLLAAPVLAPSPAIDSVQQQPAPVPISNVLPAGAKPTEVVVTRDGERTYYIGSSEDGEGIWLYDRTRKTKTRVTNARGTWHLNVAPTRDALAYVKVGERGNPDEHVWVLPLDPSTGLASGPDRLASTIMGDAPSISNDGKWLAFARDDSTGGQSLMVVPITGGPERTLGATLDRGVYEIRWTPDDKNLYFGTSGTIRRIAFNGGAVRTVVPTASMRYGLSPSGQFLVHVDTGSSARLVVSDTGGRRLRSFVLPPNLAFAGWLNEPALLLKSGPPKVRRLHSYSIADGRSRILVDSMSGNRGAPVWSPDGRNFAVVHCDGTECELRMMRADGSSRSVVPMPASPWNVNYQLNTWWSPDQKWIAYVARPEVGVPVPGFRPLPVYALEVSTRRWQRLGEIKHIPGHDPLLWTADSRGVIVSEPTDSVNGRPQIRIRVLGVQGASRVLGRITLAAGDGYIFAFDSATAVMRGQNKVLLAPFAGGKSATTLQAGWVGRMSDPTFTRYPDGTSQTRWLAFRQGADGEGLLNTIRVLRADGTGTSTVSLPFFAAGGARNPQFLPGARQLIVTEHVSDRLVGDPGVYLVTLATSSVRKLFTVPRDGSFQPEVAISPDGRTLLYTTMDLVSRTHYTIDLSMIIGSGDRR